MSIFSQQEVVWKDYSNEQQEKATIALQHIRNKELESISHAPWDD